MKDSAQFPTTFIATTMVVVSLFGCAQQSSQPESDAVNERSQSQSAQTSVQTSVQAPSSTGSNSLRAYIDPATGKLREPTPEDIAAEAAAEAARKKSAGAEQEKVFEPKEIRLPNGAVVIQLDGSAQTTLKGCVQKEGDVNTSHDCESKEDGKHP